ncbi:MAG: thioredoxin domain-containing protein [Synergistaceae bacterium]|nr:thioredoxin domain-containing protein [Synergistaceae bacterium]
MPAGENRLVNEKSPYLLRHSRDPVNWYPWGKEAFDAAEAENRPIFLLIGGSSSRWCRVMDRECFNDREVAALLNDTCISIRVDREERPDLSDLFTETCRIQNGSGGWPLNLFLTPKGEPFFAATFLPKRSTGQVPGLADIIPRVKWLWLMQKEDVLRGAKTLTDTLSTKMDFVPGGQIGTLQARNVLKELQRMYDPMHGGFNPAPKQLCVPRLIFLLEYARGAANGDRDEAFAMVDTTLRKIWSGAVHDHLGGGCANSLADRQWMTPHFEKTLRDQALLLWTVATAHELRPDEFFRRFAEDIATCVIRDFTSPESCFLTSLDADDDGEGDGERYYLWTEEEIRAALPPGDSGIFCAACAILPGGNFRNELSGVSMGQNVLYEALPVNELARRYGVRAPEVTIRLENDRRALFEARSRRPAPSLDDKVLMDWNGLMIGALARAGRVFEKKEWLLTAERAALFLQKALVDPKGEWRRRYRAKEAAIPALPGDYAAMMWGVMELYATATTERQKKDWAKYAADLAAALEANYWDEPCGGLFLSRVDEPHIFLRRKSAEDGVGPSANGMAMMAYIAMGRELEEPQYTEKARAIETCFARIAALRPIEHISIVAASLRFRDEKVKDPNIEPDDDKDAKKDAKNEAPSVDDRKDRREYRPQRERRPPRDVMRRTR